VNRRAQLVLATFGALGMLVWHGELFTVQKSGAVPVPLALVPAAARRTVEFDATLAAVPAGAERVYTGAGVTIVHYWAPWERHSGAQARGLDSLRRVLPPGSVRVAVICFDPYPSVARYVARLRLRLPVLLDQRRHLADQLACPSIPYTYVLDRSGRIAVAQAGEVDWLAPQTRSVLESLAGEPTLAPAPPERTAS